MSLHGAEASQTNGKLQKRLTTNIKDTLSKHTTHKDTNITYITASKGPDLDLDPNTNIFTNRILTLRRNTVKRANIAALALDSIRCYALNAYNGTDVDNVENCFATPAPPPGDNHRQAWSPHYKPFGPIGILAVHVTKTPRQSTTTYASTPTAGQRSLYLTRRTMS